jgi:hypothetical protein
VAVALIAGQAVLCAVIGWVTFGATQADKPGPPSAVEPLAGPPLVVPPPRVPPPTSPAESIGPATSNATARPGVTTRRHFARRAATPAPAPAPRRTAAAASVVPPATNVTPLAAVPPTTASPTDQPEIAPPSPPSPTPVDVQSAVVIGDQCNPESAPGLTVDGVSVHCMRQDDGTLRWQIN